MSSNNDSQSDPGAPLAAALDERAIDANNSDNSVGRWERAIVTYRAQHQRDGSSPFTVVLNAIIDVSGSMSGVKLVAVKLGLCAVVAHLAPSDLMAISAFCTSTTSLTGGSFFAADRLLAALPRILTAVAADGGTAFFDAVSTGLAGLSQYSSVLQEASHRNVLVVLTDGADTSSRLRAPDIMAKLAAPDINNFMFMFMYVDPLSKSVLHFLLLISSHMFF
jgi:uncharacterized protein with von Willebrand factor type A (vWA) domain